MKIKDSPDIKEIYFWNFSGNVMASAVFFLYLIIVSLLLPTKEVDTFSFAYSISYLWIIIGLFQVRNYQGTDVQQSHPFKSYLQLRIFTILLMWLTLFPYLYVILCGTYSQDKILIIVLVMLYRTCDAFSDLFQGLFQQYDRMDLAGKIMFYRYTGSVLALLISLLSSRSLTSSFIVLLFWNIFFVFIFELNLAKLFSAFSWKDILNIDKQDVQHIFCSCFPLFVNGFLLIYVINQPKLVIDNGLTERIFHEGMQRDYNILSMPVFFMALCVLMVRPLITNLAVLWQINDYKKFRKILREMLLVLILGGAFITIVSYFVGVPILSLIFGVNLSIYDLPLSILVFSGILYSVAIVFENILIIFRRYSLLTIVYVFIFLLSQCITKPLIYQYSMMGASISFLIIMFVYSMGLAVIYLLNRRGVNSDV